VVWLFARLPWASVAANVVLVPIGVALVPLTLSHGLLAAVWPRAASLTAYPVEALCEAFLVACEALAFEGASASMPPPSVFQGLAITASCLGLLFLRGRARLAVAPLLALALALSELSLRSAERPEGVLRATVLDVGQGDSILVDLPDGRAMLVDAGNVGPDIGEAVLVPLLAARRRARIDVVVLTHPHPDHFGGLATVLRAVEVGEIWDSGQAEDESPTGPASQLLEEARRRGVRVLSPADLCGRPRRFGAARAEVLWPCPAYNAGFDPNDNSLVVRLSLGERALLLTGDLERHGEAALLARPEALRADFLKVGHHGSRTSSTLPFVRAVAPRYAAISAGSHNRYGHPHAEPLEALEAVGAEVLRTDELGGLTVITDGRALEVSSVVERER
ncbi:MAG: ComEC family DNA internalization-related competence protein, partial [Polyangiaceae bacterium]|nr:ComEC family DNA internalization-related competence protein [Polyangiaceae bacterium]